MRLKNHRIDTATYTRAKAVRGHITPTVVILHDTASRLGEGSAARYLLDNPRNVSVHFVIERNGAVVQQVPTNRGANHAGRSTFQGRSGCNDFSIGIEFVNPGRMTWAGEGRSRTWFKQTFDNAEHDIQHVRTAEHDSGWWMDYTEEQIAASTELLMALFKGITSLEDITTHWYVSPGRKVDTNPLFPLEAIRAKVLGRDDPAEIAAEEASDPDQSFVQIETRGSRLNMRRWPSFNPNVIARIPNDTIVPVIRFGTFAGREWLRVLYDGQEGWIVSSYAAPITYGKD